MKQLTFTILFALLATIKIYSQVGVDISDKNMGGQNIIQYEKGKGSYQTLLLGDISGSPLVYSDAVKNTVIKTTSGELYKIPSGNYNVYTDKIVSKISRDSIFSYDDSTIAHIIFDDVKAKKYSVMGDERRYFFILNEGEKISFLKSFTHRIVKGKVNPMTHQKMTENKIQILHEYFVSEDGKAVANITLKKKTILALMADKKNEIVTFVKNNKLSYKDETDVASIFKHYNAL